MPIPPELSRTMLKLARALLSKGAAPAEPVAPAWIAVSERLPEPDVEVIGAGQGWGDPFVMACHYDAERNEWWAAGNHWSDAHGEPQYPTHWMPMPEPPMDPLAESARSDQQEKRAAPKAPTEPQSLAHIPPA
jgi:hypothetical protein